MFLACWRDFSLHADRSFVVQEESFTFSSPMASFFGFTKMHCYHLVVKIASSIATNWSWPVTTKYKIIQFIITTYFCPVFRHLCTCHVSEIKDNLMKWQTFCHFKVLCFKIHSVILSRSNGTALLIWPFRFSKSFTFGLLLFLKAWIRDSRNILRIFQLYNGIQRGWT